MERCDLDVRLTSHMHRRRITVGTFSDRATLPCKELEQSDCRLVFAVRSSSVTVARYRGTYERKQSRQTVRGSKGSIAHAEAKDKTRRDASHLAGLRRQVFMVYLRKTAQKSTTQNREQQRERREY